MTTHLDGPARVEFNGQDLTPYLASAPRRAENTATGVLDRIDNTIAGLCPCGADPRDGSPYCSTDCEPTHTAADTGYSAMRWRPDLVTAHDDTDLIPVDVVRAAETVAIREGRHNAHIYQRVSEPTTWHLRLDDGHRYVGCDLAGMGAADGIISIEQTARIHHTWQRLERELTDARRITPAHPWPNGTTIDIDPQQVRRAAQAMRAAFNGIAEAVTAVVQNLSKVAAQLQAAKVIPETPPTDPMARALWLRQHRNTGPAPRRLDGRRRGR